MELRQRYVDALCREMTMRSEPADSRGHGSIATIYLGGGTPSQLPADLLDRIFTAIYNIYKVEADAEVTIEVNPDDVTPEFAALLSRLPVNRVSMGAQTFDDRRLRFLHRRHTAGQVGQAVQRLRQAGIANISVDLMYGFPGETLADWRHDIQEAIALDVEHLSAYCLIVEEGTALYEKIKKYKNKKIKNSDAEKTRNSDAEKIKNYEKENINNPDADGGCEAMSECDEELERAMFYMLKDSLEAAGYEHYEISNYARITPPRGHDARQRPSLRSRHNSSYWEGTPYIGLGAAAHSYDGQARQWNVSDIRQYIEAIESGRLPAEREELDPDTRYNDCITVALRTREGLSLDALTARHRAHCLREARRYIDSGLLQLAGQRLSLTREGLFVSDMVMADLMIV